MPYLPAFSDGTFFSDGTSWSDLEIVSAVTIGNRRIMGMFGSHQPAIATIVGPIEPVNPSATAVTITVDGGERQTWHGYGWGANTNISGATSAAAVAFPRVQMFVNELCENIGATVIRFFTPRNLSLYTTYYAPYWNLCSPHGIDTVFVSEFIHTSNPDGTPTEVADSLLSILSTHNVPCHAISLQNEPDGSPANAVPGATSTMVNSTNAVAVANRYTEMRTKLNTNGMPGTKVLTYEWRHPQNQIPSEYDLMDSAGLIPGTINGCCYHIYDKAPDNNTYDARWFNTAKSEMWSTETGNNGSPNCQARYLAGVNHGSKVEIIHYGLIPTSTPDSEQLGQALVDWNGNPRPWYGAVQIINQNLVRGTVIRRCRSSDRPSGLDTTMADRMIRNPGATSGRTPRQQVIAGKKPNNEWVICATNVTYGTDNFPVPSFTDNHYAAITQQLTVNIGELSTSSRVFQAKRASDTGSVSGPTPVNMQLGVMRFTLAPGETIAMTG